MPLDRQLMRINPIEFKPIGFTPIQYKQEKLDYSPLRASIKEFEDNTTEAKKQKSGINASFAQMAAKMRPEDQEYISKLQQEANDRINVGINTGDPKYAIQTAIDEADRLVSNMDIQGRIEAAEYYNKFEDEINKSVGTDLSKRDAKYYLQTHKYDYTPILDEKGNIRTDIKGIYTKYNKPSKSIDYTKYARLAAGNVQPDTTSTSSSSINEKGGSSGSSNSYSAVTFDEIRANYDDIFNSTVAKEELDQDFEFSKLEYYDKLEDLQRLKDVESLDDDTRNKISILEKEIGQLRSYLFDEKGNAITDIKEFGARHVYSTMHNLAYFHKTSSRDNKANPEKEKNTTLGSLIANALSLDDIGNENGPDVKHSGKNETPANPGKYF